MDRSGRGLRYPPRLREASLYRAALTDLEQSLDPSYFIRIHRSVIVNIESVVQLESLSHGEFELLLKDGSRPSVSRTYRTSMEKRLGQRL
jgi:two-component system LytT family response regulator